jgi:HD-like signal output (HDOD) protein
MGADPSGHRARLAGTTRARLERIEDIPALPGVLIRVWDLAEREETSADDLGRAMSTDAGLTGSVLRLANSAYFGFPGKVSTVTQAIVILGFETVKWLAMGASVFRALNPGRSSGIEPKAFFRHSLLVATGARELMERIGPRRAPTSFAGGILHDLGKLVVVEFLPDRWSEIRTRIAEGEEPEEAEAEVLGLTHAGIGEWFARRWSFPDELTCAVQWHHAPQEADGHLEYAAAVHLGDVIAHRCGEHGDGHARTPTPRPEALEAFGMQEQDLGELVERVSDLAIRQQELGPSIEV